MKNMKNIYQTVHGAGWIVLAVGAVAVGGLLVYGSMPAEGQGAVQPATVAQGTLPLPAPAPAAAPAPPAAPTEDERRERAAALAAKANIDITDAWTKATAGQTAPIYLHIISAKDADRLVGAEVSAADDIELRETANAAAGAKDAAMPAVEIPAGATVEFGPNAKHFMLTGLKAPLKEGESFLITLKFDKAGTESAVVRVLGATATALPPNPGRPGDTTQAVTPR